MLWALAIREQSYYYLSLARLIFVKIRENHDYLLTNVTCHIRADNNDDANQQTSKFKNKKNKNIGPTSLYCITLTV